MNRDDIIRMAREAGLVSNQFAYGGYSAAHTDWVAAKLERFAALVAAAEREACAQVCEAQIEEWVDDRPRYAVSECVVAIRARDKK